MQETSSHSYLGVEIQPDLKWNSHINNITAQASKTLGFVRRNLGFCSKETKVAAYIALVRPTLEYCSAIWDPYKQELAQKVGKIQRRAAQLVHNKYDWQTSAIRTHTGFGMGHVVNLSQNITTKNSSQSHRGHLALPV